MAGFVAGLALAFAADLALAFVADLASAVAFVAGLAFQKKGIAAA